MAGKPSEKLTLLGKCPLIEQRYVAMNSFVAELVQRLHESGIKAVLLKVYDESRLAL